MTHDQVNWALSLLHVVFLALQIWFVAQGARYLREAKNALREAQFSAEAVEQILEKARAHRNMASVVNNAIRSKPPGIG